MGIERLNRRVAIITVGFFILLQGDSTPQFISLFRSFARGLGSLWRSAGGLANALHFPGAGNFLARLAPVEMFVVEHFERPAQNQTTGFKRAGGAHAFALIGMPHNWELILLEWYRAREVASGKLRTTVEQ